MIRNKAPSELHGIVKGHCYINDRDVNSEKIAFGFILYSLYGQLLSVVSKNSNAIDCPTQTNEIAELKATLFCMRHISDHMINKYSQVKLYSNLINAVEKINGNHRAKKNTELVNSCIHLKNHLREQGTNITFQHLDSKRNYNENPTLKNIQTKLNDFSDEICNTHKVPRYKK